MIKYNQDGSISTFNNELNELEAARDKIKELEVTIKSLEIRIETLELDAYYDNEDA